MIFGSAVGGIRRSSSTAVAVVIIVHFVDSRPFMTFTMGESGDRERASVMATVRLTGFHAARPGPQAKFQLLRVFPRNNETTTSLTTSLVCSRKRHAREITFSLGRAALHRLPPRPRRLTARCRSSLWPLRASSSTFPLLAGFLFVQLCEIAVPVCPGPPCHAGRGRGRCRRSNLASIQSFV